MRQYALQAAAAAVIMAAAVLATNQSSAQTISYTEAIDVFAQACGTDIVKHCKTARLNDGELFACLRGKEASLSVDCRTTSAATIESLNRRAAAQEEALQLCQGDVSRLCREYDEGNGRYLRCLLNSESQVSAPCNQAITDAGWR